MNKKKKAPPPDGMSKAHLAIESIPQFEEMAASAERHIEAIKKGPNYQNDKPVQDAVGDMDAAATALRSTQLDYNQAKKTLLLLEPQLLRDAAALQRTTLAVESAINKSTGGMRAKILEYGAQVATKTPSIPSTEPPTEVRGTSAPGSLAAVFACKADKRAICYHIGWGADPSNPDAWTNHAVEGGCRYTAPGPFTAGQKIYFRMAIQRRKTGLGAWSNVIEVIIR